MPYSETLELEPNHQTETLPGNAASRDGITSICDVCSCCELDAKRGDHFPQAD
jgi:hypothetical protein